MKAGNISFDIKKQPKLEPEFVPMGLYLDAFEKNASEPIAIAVYRENGNCSVYDGKIYGTAEMFEDDCLYVERIVKFLLWAAGGYRVVILWMPEKMNAECANKLLKLIEEPPTATVFLLVSDEPDAVLPTIQSRTQRLNLRPIPEADVQRALMERFSIEPPMAANVAHTAQGSWAKALSTLRTDDDTRLYTELFIRLMRLAYGRRLREMKQWSEEVAKMGRAPQKQFLDYCQRMTRESFACNFHNPQLTYMNIDETTFTARFAPFVNERNIIGITDTLADAQRDIESNVNAKMVFFDLALKMIMLLKN